MQSESPEAGPRGQPLETVTDWLDHWATYAANRVWLRDRKGDDFTEWTWAQARSEVQAVAAWLESEYGNQGRRVAILSRNRAHWLLADMAITASGNVSVPFFTTQPADAVDYILKFAGVELLFLGEAENWEKARSVIPKKVGIVTLPGVECGSASFAWQKLLEDNRGRHPRHRCRSDELLSIIFTSGTTGNPKGVMQTHDSMLLPMLRCKHAFAMRDHARFLSYLPLAHVAERQLVWIQSLIYGGSITFNETLATLVRDMAEVRPNYFFGAPRVWEQLQQVVLAQFGSQKALDLALLEDEKAVTERVQAALGLQDTDYLLTASAPTPAALIQWYDRLGIRLCEGYGQTEAMGLIANSPEERRIGSIGKPIEGVEVRIADNGEIVCRADGVAVGYYRMPKESAETFVDGWVRTGDRGRVDEDGYYYITGRVKEYFKTIQGKFVSPAPIEGAFARSPWVDQQCLLGRGYSKTAMVCVLSPQSAGVERERIERELAAQAEEVNGSIEHHARIGAVIVSRQPWTIENGMLTPTLKLRREQVEDRFGAAAEVLARQAAEQGRLLFAWPDEQSP